MDKKLLFQVKKILILQLDPVSNWGIHKYSLPSGVIVTFSRLLLNTNLVLMSMLSQDVKLYSCYLLILLSGINKPAYISL